MSCQKQKIPRVMYDNLEMDVWEVPENGFFFLSAVCSKPWDESARFSPLHNGEIYGKNLKTAQRTHKIINVLLFWSPFVGLVSECQEQRKLFQRCRYARKMRRKEFSLRLQTNEEFPVFSLLEKIDGCSLERIQKMAILRKPCMRFKFSMGKPSSSLLSFN